ncbi:MAG: AarF/UbiB family protein, partial [Chitinophagales bacterium]
NVYLTQIFEFGFFHADPHPGNVLVREDGVLCLIDFGMVGRLMLHDKYAFAGIFIGLAQQNPRMMAKSLRRLAIQDNIEDTRQLEYDLSEIIQSYAMINLSDASMAELATKIQKLIYNYQLQVPGSVFIILRTLAILEGIGKQIHPNLKAFELMKPYGRKLLQEQYSPQSIGFEAYSMVSEVMDFVYNFPGELNEIVQKVSQGKFHAEIRIEDYEKALNKADHITNRLSLTMLTVALYLSSAITMSSNAKTVATWFGHLPLISLLLLIAAIALSCILILGMSRRE